MRRLAVVLVLLSTSASAQDLSCPMHFSIAVTKPGTYYSAGTGSRSHTDELDAQMPLVKGRFSVLMCASSPAADKPIKVTFASGPCGKPIDFSKGMSLVLHKQVVASTDRPYAVTAAFESTCYSVRFEVPTKGERHVNCSMERLPLSNAKGKEA